MTQEYKETDILCFECGERFGIDCPGREPGEATMCIICFEKAMSDFKKNLEN